MLLEVTWITSLCLLWLQAEHRERLQDLQMRLSQLMERIANEDASRMKWATM
jgi:hypothetical protein